MSGSSEDIPGRDLPVQSKPKFGRPEWFTTHWKVGLAFIYSLIVVVDFIVFPVYVGIHRNDTIMMISEITYLDAAQKAELIKIAMSPYSPKTLLGGGLIHLSFGALLTGATLQSSLRRG